MTWSCQATRENCVRDQRNVDGIGEAFLMVQGFFMVLPYFNRGCVRILLALNKKYICVIRKVSLSAKSLGDLGIPVYVELDKPCDLFMEAFGHCLQYAFMPYESIPIAFTSYESINRDGRCP